MNYSKPLFILTIIFSCFLAGCFEEEQCAPQISGKEDLYRSNDSAFIPYKPKKPVTTSRFNKPLSGKTIIVDPGHGGKDPGAGKVGYSRMWEKQIVLDISQKLAANLKAKGARVIMTRTNDTFIELNDRAAFADRYRADLLISVHADSFTDSTVNGPTFYISRNNDRRSRRIAEGLEDSFAAEGIKNKGVRQANYRVLVRHSRPAVLVEAGYLTNRDDAHKLNSSWYRSKVANIITDGLVNSIQ